MAGILGEAGILADVSTGWQAALDDYHPGLPIEYFKIDEACQFKDQFNHWSPENRDARVLRLSKVVDRDDLLCIPARVDLQVHKQISARWSHIKKGKKKDPQRFHSMAEPYVLLAQYAIMATVAEAVERGATDPIEIIFDEQSLFAPTIINSYMEFRATESDPARLAVMPLHPIFRSDKTFVLLQAADMLAGEFRLIAENYPDNPSFIGTLCPSLPVSKHVADMDEPTLERLHAHVVREH